jgi:hypothetical protein
VGALKLNRAWAHSEAESDYYTGTCVVNFWQSIQKSNYLLAQELKIFLLSANDLKIKALLGAQSLFQYIHSFFGPNTPLPWPSILNHESFITSETLLNYPTLQCRLDTVALSLAKQSRPSCWFKY